MGNAPRAADSTTSPGSFPMKSSLPIAIAVGLVGSVFTLQGIGVLGGSSMTGSSFWAVVGLALLVAAGILAWRARRPLSRG